MFWEEEVLEKFSLLNTKSKCTFKLEFLITGQPVPSTLTLLEIFIQRVPLPDSGSKSLSKIVSRSGYNGTDIT